MVHSGDANPFLPCIRCLIPKKALVSSFCPFEVARPPGVNQCTLHSIDLNTLERGQLVHHLPEIFGENWPDEVGAGVDATVGADLGAGAGRAADPEDEGRA